MAYSNDSDRRYDDLLEHATDLAGYEENLDLLEKVYENLSRSTISAMLKIPAVPSVWRRGEMSADEKLSLACLQAFLESVRKSPTRIEDLDLWLNTTVTDDTTFTYRDFYITGHVQELLDIVYGEVAAAEALNKEIPDWRKRYARDTRFRVVDAPDGQKSIVPR